MLRSRPSKRRSANGPRRIEGPDRSVGRDDLKDVSEPLSPTSEEPTLRRRLFELLESGNRFRPGARALDVFLCLLIVANVAAVAAETVLPIYRRFTLLFHVFEAISVTVFAFEYLVRLWVCVEHPPFQCERPWRARLRFARTPLMIIDFLAVMPSFLFALFGADFRFLRVFRLVRLLKLVRYSGALATLLRVVYEERRALGAAVIIMFGLMMLSASVIYFIERQAQPDTFGSIPAAMWWAMATLTTVGYGDAVPVTGLGKLVGGLVTVFGIGMYALPVAIIASGFRTEFQRRDFVITWGMVARVPLFAGLDPLAVSKIARLLHSRVVPPNYSIVRRGEHSDAMYFISPGVAEVDLPTGGLQLAEGDFFGEIGLLYDTTRTASVIARTECRLMMLDAHDFHRLLEDNPDLRQEIMRIAEHRLHYGGWRVGDFLPEELRHHEPLDTE